GTGGGTLRAGVGAAAGARRREVPLLHPARGRPVGPHPGDAGDVRRVGEQRRPEERPRAAGRRPAVGDRPRADVPRGAQAADGDLGLRWGAVAEPGAGRPGAVVGRGPRGAAAGGAVGRPGAGGARSADPGAAGRRGAAGTRRGPGMAAVPVAIGVIPPETWGDRRRWCRRRWGWSCQNVRAPLVRSPPTPEPEK